MARPANYSKTARFVGDRQQAGSPCDVEKFRRSLAVENGIKVKRITVERYERFDVIG
jgi:hypothetical protein